MASSNRKWWDQVEGSALAQGDYLPECLIPCFEPDYGSEKEVHQVLVKEYDCIVVTQSCDLENDKATLVAMCPIISISQFENANPKFKEKKAWERVRTGRVEGLHMMASMVDSNDNQACYVVDFR